MVDEVIRIVITERGARATSSQIRSVGSTAKTAAIAVTGLVAALGTIAAVRGLTGLVRDSIQVSAQFEQLEVRLRTFLGSQDAASRSLENFIELSSRTPFAVAQIVEGAASLGSLALGNEERLNQLAQTAANLSAVTGIAFEQTASNLQRALSRGIASADLFRDRGVDQLIAAIAGVPDLTKVSLQELDGIIQQVFGPNGTFGQAAENLSLTLGGSISNIDDAFNRLQDAIGDAFAPAVINSARLLIIPFLDRLRVLVVDNQEAFRDLATSVIPVVLEGMVELGRAALEAGKLLAQFLGTVGEIQLSRAQSQLRDLTQERNRAFVAARRLSARIADQGSGADPDLLRRQESLRDRLRETVQALEAQRTEVERLTNRQNNFADTFTRVEAGINAAQDRLRGFREDIQLTDFGAELPDEQDLPDLPAGAGEREDPEVQQARVAAETKILDILQRQRIARARSIEPLDAELEKLRQQQGELEAQVAILGETEEAVQARRLLGEQILGVEREKVDLLDQQARLETEIASLLTDIETSSPELATQLRDAALAAIDTGDGLADIVRQLEAVRTQAQNVAQREAQRVGRIGEEIGQTLADGIGSSLRGALDGEAVNFGQRLADVSSELLDLALREVLQSVSSRLGDLFEGAEGGAGGFGTALAGALGVGLGLVAGAVRDTSAEISNNLASSSAVESVAATRGIVAGPQNIPILAVGEGLESAVEPIVQLLAELVDLERARSGGASAGGLTDPANELQASNSLI